MDFSVPETPEERLERIFRGYSYIHTSDLDHRYNCIAWAVGDTEQWWEPTRTMPWYYWPPDVPKSDSLSSLELALGTRGFVRCDATFHYETGFDKIVVFRDEDFWHVSRVLEDGRLSSKLGLLEDATHSVDWALNMYGEPVIFLKRDSAA